MLQSLIKKHFPAPGNKLEELFGFDSGTNGRSSPSSQQLTPVKRKKKVSTSESDSDDSGKGIFSMQDKGLMNTGNSGSEDEDPWLHRKSKKGSRGKSLTGSPDISAADPSFNALAAAGLKVSNMSWSIPTRNSKTNQWNQLLTKFTFGPLEQIASFCKCTGLFQFDCIVKQCRGPL